MVGSPSCAALGEAVLRVADFDGAPVAGPDQADEAQQVGEGPRHIGGVVATGESPSTNLSGPGSGTSFINEDHAKQCFF